MIHSNSARITSDPSQAELPGAGAGLPSGGGKVAVILEEAMDAAGINLYSQSPIVLVLNNEKEGRGKLVYSRTGITKVSREVKIYREMKIKLIKGKATSKLPEKLDSTETWRSTKIEEKLGRALANLIYRA
jgi:hypothetical protein